MSTQSMTGSQKDDMEERGGVRLRWCSQEFARGRMLVTHSVLILGGNGPVMAAPVGHD